jgi:hypothetical protein
MSEDAGKFLNANEAPGNTRVQPFSKTNDQENSAEN